MALFDKIMSVVSWIEIFCAPFFAGMLFGMLSWFAFGNLPGQILGVILILAGTVGGVRFAENVRKKYGTTEFVAKIQGGHELDEKEEE